VIGQVGSVNGGRYGDAEFVRSDALQMELARFCAEVARLKMKCDILKKATAYFAEESI
jgi:hypothetical protein